MSAAQVVREYGQAMRGDWSEVDGRAVRNVMDDIASWIEGTYPGDDAARARLGVCPAGHGHWTEYCDDDCTPTPKETPDDH